MNKKIKIAIDISPTLDGNSTRGVGYYTQNLVDALQKEIKINPNYKNWSVDLIKNSQELKANSYKLIHYPYFDPFKLTLPINKKIPTIITVHDLIPRQFKNHFPVGLKGEIKWFIQKNKLKKVSQIITVSQYSKNIINQITHYPLSKIQVTHLAADDSFKPITDSKKLSEIKNKYKLPNKFVLFVGDINWNKNIPNLVRSCRKLKIPLVIVGSAAVKQDVPDHPWTQDLRWLQSKSRVLTNQRTSPLILTGFVPDEDLPYIYNLATVYCQSSFAEGFGLPLVQAMQSGCPVAFSRDTCLPEIMDSVGLSFNPRSTEDIVSKIKKFWNNPKFCQLQKELGLSRSKNFKWSNTAQKTLDVYSSVLSHE